MVESCRRWAKENDPEHAGEYPLPLQDGRRAILALRVRRRRSVLDLFGLAGYKPQPMMMPEILPPGVTYEQIGHDPALENPDDYLWGGPMACVLSAVEDESLLELAKQAPQWWRSLSHMVRRGRPPGSGIYSNPAEFEREALAALQGLYNESERPTQEKLADRLGISYDSVQDWLKKLKEQRGVDWPTLKKQARRN